MIVEVLLLFVLVLIILLATRRKPEGLPPGEWGWPIIGSLPSKNIPLPEYIEKYKKKFGKTFTWKMGSRTFVFLTDYKILKSAFNNPMLVDRPRMFSLDIFSDFQRLGFVNTNGIRWQNFRRFSLRHLRDNGMGKSSLEDVINYEADCLVKDFLNHTDVVTETPWSVNVAVLNVLWGIISDKRYDVSDKKIQEFERLITDLFLDAQSVGYIVYDLFPWISAVVPNKMKSFLGLSEGFRRIALYKDYLMGVIVEHQNTLEEDKPRDYIDSYLIEMKKHAEGRGSEGTSTFSIPELVYLLSDIFAAGSETTSSTIRWIFVYMIKYPEVQRKVQEQIDEFVPRDRLPGLQDREKLPYVDATFLEVMRLKSIAPIGLYHAAREDTLIENFRIPKGTVVVSAIDVCHSDPDYWENPQDFNPDRFLRPDGSCDGKKDAFLPFSIGRRVCPGESLARMELFLFAAALLQKFNFSAPEGMDVILEPDASSPLFVIPKPFKMIITERK